MTRADLSDKTAFVRIALEELAAIPQSTYDEFSSDRRNLPAAIHWLQTAIQALIDIGLVSIAARGLPTPRSSVEVLERLEEAGVLPAGTPQRYPPGHRVRQPVVHLHPHNRPQIVYRIVVEDRGDLAQLLGLLLDASND